MLLKGGVYQYRRRNYHGDGTLLTGLSRLVENEFWGSIHLVSVNLLGSIPPLEGAVQRGEGADRKGNGMLLIGKMCFNKEWSD